MTSWIYCITKGINTTTKTRLKREHAHVVCLRCGAVQEFFGRPLQSLKEQIESDFGFKILVARTEVGGYCADCQGSVADETEALPEPVEDAAPKTPPRLPGLGRRPVTAMPSDGSSGLRAARAPTPLHLSVVDSEGARKEVEVNRSPFRIGRLPDCDLSLRDSRISRNHAQILLENGKHFLEDLDSRHGVTVNGLKVKRHQLSSGDHIEFGVDDSYKVFVGAEPGFSAPLMEKVAALPTEKSPGNLGQLSAVLDVALALQSSLAVDDVLAAAVDAALVVTHAERGFLMLTDEQGELKIRVARDRDGKILSRDDLLVPRTVIRRALESRRDLLSMVFDPSDLEDSGAADTGTVEALALRSVVCVPLVRIRVGQQHETSVLSARQDTLGVLYADSKQGELAGGNREFVANPGDRDLDCPRKCPPHRGRAQEARHRAGTENRARHSAIDAAREAADRGVVDRRRE